jgi:hypothetical protein
MVDFYFQKKRKEFFKGMREALGHIFPSEYFPFELKI